jgi:hypothetical protein
MKSAHHAIWAPTVALKQVDQLISAHGGAGQLARRVDHVGVLAAQGNLQQRTAVYSGDDEDGDGDVRLGTCCDWRPSGVSAGAHSSVQRVIVLSLGGDVQL